MQHVTAFSCLPLRFEHVSNSASRASLNPRDLSLPRRRLLLLCLVDGVADCEICSPLGASASPPLPLLPSQPKRPSSPLSRSMAPHEETPPVAVAPPLDAGIATSVPSVDGLSLDEAHSGVTSSSTGSVRRKPTRAVPAVPLDLTAAAGETAGELWHLI